MQVVVALMALPLVAALLALASRLEDGLRVRASSHPMPALPAGPLAVVAAGDGVAERFADGLADSA
jgi:hypothetical protein